jgi:UDP-N-acetylmuramoyl-L-alanyl-D-glutamate--2,6-diaminopimelate ligase
MQPIILNNNATAIIDYSHTPDALKNAIIACREIITSSKAPTAKIICVFGCGGDRDKSKRPIMGEIASKYADFSIITNDNPRSEKPEEIFNDIMSGVKSNNFSKVKQCPSRKEAILDAIKMSRPYDIILIAGKGHENYQIIGNQRSHFNDYETVYELNP